MIRYVSVHDYDYDNDNDDEGEEKENDENQDENDDDQIRRAGTVGGQPKMQLILRRRRRNTSLTALL